MASREIPMNIREAIASFDPSTTNVAAFCRDHSISRSRFYEIRARFNEFGAAGLEPRSRAPRSVANRTSDDVEDVIVELRKHLASEGLDAGPETIRVMLEDRIDPGVEVPSVSTIWRVLTRRGFVTPDPRKAPGRVWKRFVADRPNELWQMDDWSYPLMSGTIVDIIDVLDDHSRLVPGGHVVPRCTQAAALESLCQAADRYGWPQTLLTDNARTFTTLREPLAQRGVQLIHSRPYHPQTCGKVERFHYTERLYLNAHGPYRRIADLQRVVDRFRDYYNHHRPHRAVNRKTPAATWAATGLSGPSGPLAIPDDPETKIYHCVVSGGRVDTRTYRITVGAVHDREPATVMITGTNAHVFINGRCIRQLTIDPTRKDQPLHDRPGRPTPR
jgi:transposase InsO family protein